VKGIEEQTRKWAGLKQDNLLMITENSSPVNNTYKSLLGVIFRNRGLRDESEYNAGHQPPGHKRLIEGTPRLFPVGWMNLLCVLIV